MATTAPATFSELLQQAVTEPGLISSAYTAFHNYSLGNQILAWFQCRQRGIQPGPIATFPRWKELGRYVRKGEKAITLCMPITVKRTTTTDDGTEETEAIAFFTYRANWFVVSQTSGAPMSEMQVAEWAKERALTALKVEEIPFTLMNGNCLGFARGRSIAINPVNPLPWKTTFHELAHVLLGHTSEGVEHSDGEITPRNLKECEAEAVALLCCAALNLPGVEFSRGYIQQWWGAGNPIPERSAMKILKVADRVLKAGVVNEGVGPMRAALYARVSTFDQEPENQLQELRRYCEARGWGAVEFVDRGVSGAKDKRPALDAMLKEAKRRKVDVVVCWRLDRFGRNLRSLITMIADLQAVGVAFVSLGEGIDCTTPAGKLQLHILGALAEFERERIRERVLAGLQRARAQGKKLGRPPKRGGGVRGAALRWGVSRSTAARWIAEGRQTGQ